MPSSSSRIDDRMQAPAEPRSHWRVEHRPEFLPPHARTTSHSLDDGRGTRALPPRAGDVSRVQLRLTTALKNYSQWQIPSETAYPIRCTKVKHPLYRTLCVLNVQKSVRGCLGFVLRGKLTTLSMDRCDRITDLTPIGSCNTVRYKT